METENACIAESHFTSVRHLTNAIADYTMFQIPSNGIRSIIDVVSPHIRKSPVFKKGNTA